MTKRSFQEALQKKNELYIKEKPMEYKAAQITRKNVINAFESNKLQNEINFIKETS